MLSEKNVSWVFIAARQGDDHNPQLENHIETKQLTI